MAMKRKLWGRMLAGGICTAAVAVAALYLFSGKNDARVMLDGREVLVPRGSVHWHPRLTIRIDGREVLIPNNIGAGTGRIVDTHLSGMSMSPTHTHESDGTLHIENLNPLSKPETLTLGYFFEVWGKTFTSECIFDSCTDKGKLKMYVNGMESAEFGSYAMHDGDEMVIEYATAGG